MADAVAVQTIQDGLRHLIIKATNVSDGTGESAVTKVDVSALASNDGKACTAVTLEKVWAMTAGMGVDILWDADTDVLALHVPADITEEFDYREFGGLPNNAGTGKTGDVKVSTVGHSSGDRYTLVMQFKKVYG